MYAAHVQLVTHSFWLASKRESCVTVSCRDDGFRAKTVIATAVKKQLEKSQLNRKTMLKSPGGSPGSSGSIQ